MVAASIYSLYRNSDLLPNNIVIVSDGTWEPIFGVRYFQKKGIKVQCIMWKQCADYYKESLPELATWAQKHIWGKKMASILYISETNHTLFADPDVLWYNTPLYKNEWDSTIFKISIDNCHSYDSEYIKSTNAAYLYDTKDPINCGVIYLYGGFKLLNNQAINCIRYQAKHCGDFAEQTVFAFMDLQYGNRWTREEIISSIDDVIQPFFSKTILYPNTIARHYLYRLKWIYWTEFFKMRLH